MPGVVAVLDGHQLTGDGIGNIICGWMVHSKDGSPMNMGAWSALATDTVRYVGDAVCVVIADDERHRAHGGRGRRDRLRRAGSRRGLARRDEAPARRRSTPRRPATSSSTGRSATRAATDAAFADAANVVEIDIRNNRLVALADGNARRARRLRRGRGPFHAAHDERRTRTSRRLVLSAFYQVAPEHKLRVIAPDVGGGFGAKIYIYPEEIVCLWAVARRPACR